MLSDFAARGVFDVSVRGSTYKGFVLLNWLRKGLGVCCVLEQARSSVSLSSASLISGGAASTCFVAAGVAALVADDACGFAAALVAGEPFAGGLFAGGVFAGGVFAAAVFAAALFAAAAFAAANFAGGPFAALFAVAAIGGTGVARAAPVASASPSTELASTFTQLSEEAVTLGFLLGATGTGTELSAIPMAHQNKLTQCLSH